MGKDVTIGADTMEATEGSKLSKGEPQDKPPFIVRCPNCRYSGGMNTVWHNDLHQLWLACPVCGRPLMPLKDVPLP